MDSDGYLDSLFHKAQQDATEMSFEEASATFMQTTLHGGGWDSFLAGLKGALVVVGILSIGTFLWLDTRPNAPLQGKKASDSSPIEIDATQVKEQLRANALPTKKRSIEAEKPLKNTESQPVLRPTEPLTFNQPFKPVAVPQPLSKRIVVAPTSLVVSSSRTLPSEFTARVPLVTPMKFQINESSSTKTLARISAMAERAGINYTYVVDLKKNLIREFNVEMFIKGTNKATTIQVNVPTEGQFEIEFGWSLNENGKAIELSPEVTVQGDKAKHPLTQTLARNLYRIYSSKGTNFLRTNFDQLCVGFKPKRSRDKILNITGYYFLHENRLAEAIEIFSLNCQLFPKEPNTWDSLGEAFYRSGRKAEALQAFNKALEIKPNFHSAKAWVRQILSEK